MGIEQLMSRYLSLRQDLEIAYKAQPWNGARIDRLTNDIARTEHELASRGHLGASHRVPEHRPTA